MAPRKPQDPGFDYNNLDMNEELFFKGFGINDTQSQIKITSRRRAVIQEVNAHNFERKSTNTKQIEKEYQEAVYNAFPEFSEAPAQWKAAAVSWWMAQAGSSIETVKPQPTSRDDDTPNKSQKRGSKRERGDSPGNHDARPPRKMPHVHSLRSRSEDGSVDDTEHLMESDESVPASVESRFREPVDGMRNARIQPPAPQNPGPASHGLARIRFAQVPSNEVFAEISIANVSSGSMVSWEKLASVAQSLSNFSGFRFANVLYLSPRENQRFAITHQGLLNTALEDFPPGSVPICTTKPVSASHHDGSGGSATSDRKDVVHSGPPPPQAPSLPSSNLNTSGGFNAPRYLHPAALVSRQSRSLPSTWNVVGGPSTYSRGISAFPPNYKNLVGSSRPYTKRDHASKNSEKSDTLAPPDETTELSRNSSGHHKGAPSTTDNNIPLALDTNRAGNGCPEAPPVPTAKQPPNGGSDPRQVKDRLTKTSRHGFNNGEVIDLTRDSDEDQPQAGRARKDGEAGLLPEQSNTTRTIDVSTITENEQSAPEDDDDDEEPEDNKEADARAMAAAAEYTLSLADTTTARQFAAKTDIKYWKEAAELYGLPVSALQVPDDTPKVRVPSSVGISPDYCAFPHQIVGSSEMFKGVHGPMRGCMLADEMGFGKTDTTILIYVINFFGVAKTWSGVPELEALTFPSIGEGGTINGIRPRVGATFVSASPQGVESWPESWARIMRSSKALREFPADWRPKLVLLHGDGAKYCEKHGGERMGLYSTMTRQEWAEVLPLPDWDNRSRTPQRQTTLGNHRWTGPSDWPASPGATVDRPAPTSTRYIIVCTNQSWRSRITCTWNDNAASREYKGWVKALNDPHPAKKLTQKARMDLEQKINNAKTEYFHKKGHMRDGFGPTQARRPCERTTAKGTKKSDFEICDLSPGACVVIDEIHAAASENTVTYTEIVDRFRHNRAEEDWPGVIGITGSPLANGIGTTGVFAAKALQRKTPTHDAVRALATFSLETFMGAWNHLQKTFRKAQRIRGKTKRQRYVDEQLANNRQIEQMNQIFGHIMRYFFIQRDYSTRDPWGRKLNLIPAQHVVEYCSIEFEDEYHKKLLAAEQAVRAAANDKWEDAVRDWEAHGMSGDRPARPTLERADPAAYLTARLLADFPNLLDAIHIWQDANPSKPRIIGDACAWGNSLGTANRQVQLALRSEQDIRHSFLWDIAAEACKGSAKMAYIIQQARSIGSQTSCVPHPDAQRRARGEMCTYRKKVVITSGMRLARALLWCRVVQVFRDEEVVGITSSKDCWEAVPKWRDVQGGPVWIMVAALGAICQSITLTEGHVLYALEPTSNNSKAVQVANRQYRIGQLHDKVRVQWLLHHNSFIEQNIASGNQLRNKFADGVKGVKVEDSSAPGTKQGRTAVEEDGA